MITIRHTYADGTTIDGSDKGDGVWEIAKSQGWRFSGAVGIYLRGSRDRDADAGRVERLRAALADAGHEVTVEVDNTPRSAAEREADRADRVDARVDRLDARAARRAAESDARREASDRITDGIPMGQPVQPPGHHSRNAHLRALDRSDAHMRKSIELGEESDRVASRAAGSAANEAAKHNPRAIMRRIGELEAEGRRIERELSGHERVFRNARGRIIGRDVYEPATGDQAEALRRRAAVIAEDVAHQRAKLAEMERSGAFVAWSRDDFQRGDLVLVCGSWLPVRRVNAKSVSVPGGYGFAGPDASWNATATWDTIHGRRRDGMQLDTPNGQPWPVEMADKVARWAVYAARGERARSFGPGYDENQRREAEWARMARRIVYGLPTSATDAEVEAVTASIPTVDVRDVHVRYVDVFDRLADGEPVQDITATLEPVAGDPAWRLPAGREPEDRRAGPGWPHVAGTRFVAAGDLVAGVYDRGGSGRLLDRGFCGPVASVSGPVDRRERGEFVTITLTTGAERTLDVTRWLAVYPAGTWESRAEPAAVPVYAEDGGCRVCAEPPTFPHDERCPMRAAA